MAVPRIRTIKPAFARHEALQALECSHAELRPMLTFSCLWMLCDREGRFEWRPKQLKLDILPFVPYDLAAALDLLAEKEFIVHYEVAGKSYGYIPSWSSHQHINVKESKSTIPAPDSDGAKAVKARGEVEREGEKEREEKPSAKAAPRGASSNPARVSNATAETRHTRVRQIIQGWYRDWAGVECPWDGSEAKNLDRMLKAWPNQPDQQFVTCLDNLARSDCVPRGDRPREWLGKLPKFVQGPLDQFWKSKGNGKHAASDSFAAEGHSIAPTQADIDYYHNKLKNRPNT